jgi:hypothetical protein
MQTHFLKTKNENGSYVAVCGKLYRGSGYMVGGKWFPVTTVAAEVDCKKCAAKVGVTVAAKVEKNPSGTCACCFAGQKVKPTGTMFKHGYQRPGVGYILGGCPGDTFPQYEISCEGTKYVLGLATNALAGRKAMLAKAVVATEVETRVEYGRGEYIGRRYVRQSMMVTVSQSDVWETSSGPLTGFKHFVDPAGGTHNLSFNDLHNSQVRSLEREIKQVEGDIAFLNEKIAAWKAV